LPRTPVIPCCARLPRSSAAPAECSWSVRYSSHSAATLSGSSAFMWPRENNSTETSADTNSGSWLRNSRK
jgi:hypothetical protein